MSMSEDEALGQPPPPTETHLDAPPYKKPFKKAHPEHIFRAAPMTLLQLYFEVSSARDIVAALGSLHCVHFNDLNSKSTLSAKPFYAESNRLNALMRDIEQMESQTHTEPDFDPNTPFLTPKKFEDTCTEINGSADRLDALYKAYKKLVTARDELLEERRILTAVEKFFNGSSNSNNNADIDDESGTLLDSYLDEENFEVSSNDDHMTSSPAHHLEANALLNSGIIAGAVDYIKLPILERLCWRSTRGNLYFAKYPVEGDRGVFVVYCHGRSMSNKVVRICESMNARILPSTSEDRKLRLKTANARLDEVLSMLDRTQETLYLEQDNIIIQLGFWRSVVTREISVYDVLNKFSSERTRSGLSGEAWVPTNSVMNVQNVVKGLSEQTSTISAAHVIHTSSTPPTMHTLNKVTTAFQAMVDVYGVCKLGEVNPGLPTVVTFPFMFAVMFGDIGHGFLLFLGALYLCLNERTLGRRPEKLNEILGMAFSGRYVLLFMGLFSMCTGLLYNDIFSKPLTLFTSGWIFEQNGVVAKSTKKTYPMGLDWAWHAAENSLKFTNSYKMKLSVLLGFAHMLYSLMFSLVNAKFFNSELDIIGNFVPSFLFMMSIFGYLSLTIVYKWCIDWKGHDWQPPSLLDMLIKMFLSPGTVDEPLYRGQKYIQIILLLIALVCVPWLLLYKPLTLRKQLQNKQPRSAHVETIYRDDESTIVVEPDATQDSIRANDDDDNDNHVHESFGDIMVHQTIHTIEFCLNCVSHTASYLRLWALSLAHSQLSQVLWNMTIKMAFGPTGTKGVIMVVFLFGAWFVITCLVLVCMEGTSAMLHALRLQWVESMSKHFIGGGYAFEPLIL